MNKYWKNLNKFISVDIYSLAVIRNTVQYNEIVESIETPKSKHNQRRISKIYLIKKSRILV